MFVNKNLQVYLDKNTRYVRIVANRNGSLIIKLSDLLKLVREIQTVELKEWVESDNAHREWFKRMKEVDNES